ncbi:hypothetical protein [Pseudomonas baetica]|uniref:hypothetical protein n=1 Tax=Pseudomonas baetica TaxID=674054 RepID=UPI002404ED77|nr:hypothetical protein [Pseudomonas baetica]MDF9778973.1 hypothetical protein [Pseudomonas baetica]
MQQVSPAHTKHRSAPTDSSNDPSLANVAAYLEQTISRLEAHRDNLLSAVCLIAMHDEQRNANYWLIQRTKAANRIDPPAFLQIAQSTFEAIDSVASGMVASSALTRFLHDNGAGAKAALGQFNKQVGR